MLAVLILGTTVLVWLVVLIIVIIIVYILYNAFWI